MRNLKYIIPVLALAAATSLSCKKEAALQPSTDKLGYTLPQGNSSYDTTILGYYNKYGVYMLYNFSGKDTYWTPTGWKNGDSVSNTAGYLVTQGNTAYVAKQLGLIGKLWFSNYTDKFLKDFLPSRILLCGTLDSVYFTYVFTPTTTYVFKRKGVSAWYNYDNICVNYASPAVDTMKTRDSINCMAKMNLIFIQSIIGRNLANPTSDFASLTNYSATISSQAAAYGAGILYTYYNGPTAVRDWGVYMQAMVSCSETRLNQSTANTDATFNGILNATKDVNGIIRKRYNILRNYFINNYGVDLQAIGNAADR
ncbi:MAG: hypothetical protein JST39_06390 [Bacteroidetes bacterium]|nr:hypothetical protein [Bacteroidota bacterium]